MYLSKVCESVGVALVFALSTYIIFLTLGVMIYFDLSIGLFVNLYSWNRTDCHRAAIYE